MCLQCMADAQHVFKSQKPVLPKTKVGGPYYLVRAVCGCRDDWPQGYYGLVVCNDPEVIWKGLLASQPDLRDASANRRREDRLKDIRMRYRKWEDHLKDIRMRFFMNPRQGYELVTSCMAAGYDPRKHSDEIQWLMGYLRKQIKKRRLATPADWDEAPFSYQKKTRKRILASPDKLKKCWLEL